jgi:hypothetical protein
MGQLRQRINAVIFILLGIAGWNPAGAEENDKEIKPPQPGLTITFERSNVEIGDSILIVVQVSNSSDYNLTDLLLVMDGPGWVSLSDTGKGRAGQIGLDEVLAYSMVARSHILVRVGTSGQVGDFNILFALQYKWKEGNNVHQGQVSVEKPLKIGLFGTDNVIGVPLAFAQFIVPGLFFLFMLRILKVSENKDMAADEKIIVSVIVSVICLFLVDLIGKNVDWEWTKQFNLGSTISVQKLFVLALSGVFLGIVVFLVWAFFRWRRKKQQEKLAFTGQETNAGLVYKALKLNQKYEGFPWQLSAKEGGDFICAHYFETDFSYILVGAFKIDQEKLTDEDKTKIKKHCTGVKIIQTRKHLLAVIKILGGETATLLEVRNPVKKVTESSKTDLGRFYTLDKSELRSKSNVQEDFMKLIELA